MQLNDRNAYLSYLFFKAFPTESGQRALEDNFALSQTQFTLGVSLHSRYSCFNRYSPIQLSKTAPMKPIQDDFLSGDLQFGKQPARRFFLIDLLIQKFQELERFLRTSNKPTVSPSQIYRCWIISNNGFFRVGKRLHSKIFPIVQNLIAELIYIGSERVSEPRSKAISSRGTSSHGKCTPIVI